MKDQPYLEAEQKIHSMKNHPRIKPFTNIRIRAITIRTFMALFVDGLLPKGG